jgi:hypothetical protein
MSVPIFPDIKKAPPRFVWSRKFWQVDVGKTLSQVEHIPQLQEAAVLYQSYDYNSQHAYGKRPTYTAVVNKEFRPPLIDRDDILPLSRIPRPVIIPHLNPGGAHPSGNNSFSDQNINIPDVGKYLTNRVKEGQIQPTFFCPIDMPEDNSILPDLEEKMPSYSAGAGFKFPTVADTALTPDREYIDSGYKQFHPEQYSGMTPVKLDAPNATGRENFTMDYTMPQVSATAGMNSAGAMTMGLTPVDMEMVYNTPQVSAWAGYTGQSSWANPRSGNKHDQNMELEYNRPSYSVGAGTTTRGAGATTPVEYNFSSKLEGSIPMDSGKNMSHVTTWSHDDSKASVDHRKIYDVRPDVSYVVPSNTRYKDGNELASAEPKFRQKAAALGTYQVHIHQSSIPRAGISTPQLRLKGRKDA